MKREKNPDQLFDMFGSLNNNDPLNLRFDMISRIKHECNYYETVSKDHLKRIGLNIHQWLSLMESPSVYRDKLMLFALAQMFHRHDVVFTRYKCWSTIGLDDFITGECLLKICDLKLLYIGQHMFAELKQKPFIPVMKPVVCKIPTYTHLEKTDPASTPSAIH